MRIAVLWPPMSGYVDACLRELAALGDQVLLSYERPDARAPFDESRFGWVDEAYAWTGRADSAELRRRLEAFRPDVLFVSSWHIQPYRDQLRAWSGRAVRVLCMDNQWRGAPKQWAGRASARWYLAPLYDAAWVPGERAARYARMLGFAEDRIWHGVYSADQPLFEAAGRSREEGPPSFAFVGRLVPEKGVDLLAAAYALHRRRHPSPWPLHVYGAGPLASAFDGVPGAELRGFVQPPDLPGTLARETCLLLPSRFEPWGVVVHEAAAAGAALVCSTRVGAADRLLQDRWNGLLVPPDDVAALAAALDEVASWPAERLQAASAGSVALSRQLTPAAWARALHERVDRLAPALRARAA